MQFMYVPLYEISLLITKTFWPLYFSDPDGYIIRKWNSKELNNGVLSGRFQLPEFPKIGFWKVRVEAQGQVNEKAIKVEKYYNPKFEVYVRMPTFILDSEEFIEV